MIGFIKHLIRVDLLVIILVPLLTTCTNAQHTRNVSAGITRTNPTQIRDDQNETDVEKVVREVGWTSTRTTPLPTDPPQQDEFLRRFGWFLNRTQVPHESMKPAVNKTTNRPPCAKSDFDTFCDFSDVKDYPNRDVIRPLVKYTRDEFANVFGFGVEFVRTTVLRKDSSGNVIEGADPNETDICDKVTSVFYPRSARNDKKDWVYIVNNEEFVQAVTSEKCANAGTMCSYLGDGVLFGYKSTCRQKYAYKKLLAIHPTEKKTYSDYFPIPSCCACYISET